MSFCLIYIIGISKALSWHLCFLAFPGEFPSASTSSFDLVEFLSGEWVILGAPREKASFCSRITEFGEDPMSIFKVLSAGFLKIVYSPTLGSVQMILRAANGAYPIPLPTAPCRSS